jgi:hypothetical protein
MPETKPILVEHLSLDLANFRTVRQKNELAAVQAIIATSPDRFWALVASLMADGYLPTENILVIRDGPSGNTLTVKEGNRRIAAMKLLHRFISPASVTVPDDLARAISSVGKPWRAANASVPCAIFKKSESEVVDRIVTLAHGKGEKAGRDQWNAVARARHNRDVSSVPEPALDLLEAYLRKGQNVTSAQKSRWSGDYPLTVLEEAMKRIAPRLGLRSASALASTYPSIKYRAGVEDLLRDIGLKEVRFEHVRAKDVDFGSHYGLPAAKSTNGSKGSGQTQGGSGDSTKGSQGAKDGNPKGDTAKPKALAIQDPKAVRRLLKAFAPRGKGREKLVALKDEAGRLDIAKTPLAFSFLLRSMFEISAKVYCADHVNSGGPSLLKKDGSDRALADILRDIVKHLTMNNKDKAMVKALHGAMTELGKPDGLFSVTSLNQLVHNPRFAISPSDVAIRFGNVFPLLEEMSR